jgi:hypothetical protein
MDKYGKDENGNYRHAVAMGEQSIPRQGHYISSACCWLPGVGAVGNELLVGGIVSERNPPSVAAVQAGKGFGGANRIDDAVETARKGGAPQRRVSSAEAGGHSH